jgi:hypothetical protein
MLSADPDQEDLDYEQDFDLAPVSIRDLLKQKQHGKKSNSDSMNRMLQAELQHAGALGGGSNKMDAAFDKTEMTLAERVRADYEDDLKKASPKNKKKIEKPVPPMVLAMQQQRQQQHQAAQQPASSHSHAVATTTCGACGVAVSGKFCAECGTPAIQLCVTCGAAVTAKFCAECGTARSLTKASGQTKRAVLQQELPATPQVLADAQERKRQQQIEEGERRREEIRKAEERRRDAEEEGRRMMEKVRREQEVEYNRQLREAEELERQAHEKERRRVDQERYRKEQDRADQRNKIQQAKEEAKQEKRWMEELGQMDREDLENRSDILDILLMSATDDAQKAMLSRQKEQVLCAYSGHAYSGHAYSALSHELSHMLSRTRTLAAGGSADKFHGE